MSLTLPGDADTLLGVVYLSGYLAIGVVGARREWRERQMPRWLFLVAAATLAVEAIGMFLYLADLVTASLARAWVAAFALIVLANALELQHAYGVLVSEPETGLSEDEVRTSSIFAVGATVLVALPSLWMNFRLAFG